MERLDTDNARRTLASSAADAATAGALLKERRDAQGLTLAEVVARSTVPSTQYLHNLERGRIHPGRSKHLDGLIQVLALTRADLAVLTGQRSTVSTDVRYPTRLVRPLLLAASSQVQQEVGAYTLEADPSTVIVMDPSETNPVPGQHYVLLLLQRGSDGIQRGMAFEDGETVRFLVGYRAVNQGDVKVLGRIVHEGRTL